MRVLVLNAGSSTLKASWLANETDDAEAATIEWPAGEAGAERVLREALDNLPAEADAVGYRVVHGGARYTQSSIVDEALVDEVEALDSLAPLHNRRAAAVMRAGWATLPSIPHVACFDTAFHASLPEAARRYPLPSDWVDRWSIRRYGFHGLSIAWSVRRAGELLGRPLADQNLVVAHLGSGCSVTAIASGRSVETSMGFTPYEGLMMGTRAGSVDPGILLHVLVKGVTPTELAEGLSRRSGLRAIGGSPDVRELERRAADGDPAARLALEMFVRRAAAAIAAASTTLDRLDGLVFTGGIGEHAVTIRGRIAERLRVIGIPRVLRHAAQDAIVGDGPPAVVVVGAREDLVIANEVRTLLS